MTDAETNPVGFLQEFAQKFNVPSFPQYMECGESGPPHARKFTCRCEFHGFEVVSLGSSKKQAKTESAKNMIELLKKDGYFDIYKVKINSNVSNTTQSKEAITLNKCEAITLNSTEAITLNSTEAITLNSTEAITSKPTEPISLNKSEHQPTCLPNIHRKNPISLLQEFCQKNFIGMPMYLECDSLAGEFLFECRVNGKKAIGTGSSKKSAKTESAMEMCNLLNILEDKSKVNINSNESNTIQIKEAMTVNKYDAITWNKSEAIGLNKSEQQPTCLPNTNKKNPISLLQEYCQQRCIGMPKYLECDSLAGEFVTECQINEKKTYGTGASKKSAKTESAVEMCILLNILDKNNDFKHSVQVEEELFVHNNTSQNKHPVSLLQEFCVRRNLTPVYENECGSSGTGLFVVTCSVDNITGKGKHSTKKGAKELAAASVLNQLPQTNDSPERHMSIQKALIENGMLAEPKDKCEMSSFNNKTLVQLKEFQFSSDSEDDTEETQNNISLQSLSLNDSVVEIDPGSDDYGKNKLKTNGLEGKMTDNERHSEQGGAKQPTVPNVMNHQQQQEIQDRAERHMSVQKALLENGMLAEPKDKCAMSSFNKTLEQLQEFRLNSDSEDDTEETQNNSKLQSLSLNASVVEIDPGSDDYGKSKLKTNGLEDDKNVLPPKTSTSEILMKWANKFDNE